MTVTLRDLLTQPADVPVLKVYRGPAAEHVPEVTITIEGACGPGTIAAIHIGRVLEQLGQKVSFQVGDHGKNSVVRSLIAEGGDLGPFGPAHFRIVDRS